MIEIKRHSLSHMMAQAVQRLKGNEPKLGIGPAIQDGFYYDMIISLTNEDLPKITDGIKQIINEKQPFKRIDCDFSTAQEINALLSQPYKEELAHDFFHKGETNFSFYLNLIDARSKERLSPFESYYSFYSHITDYCRQKGFISDDQFVTFIDMCAGPHIENTGEIEVGSYKVHTLAGAYWKGSEENVMMTRLYGYAFDTKQELVDHLARIEEAKKRDHRIIGQKLELFAFDEEVGPGLPLWLPKGAIMVEELEKLAKEKEEEQGYSRVRSPHIAKDKLYLRSGHLPYYEEDMFPAMELDGERYYLKSMNCPHHHKIFGATPKSYRDLPMRLAEHGHCYRYEDSGSLMGLMRVRSLCMNDAHIYCTEEQFEEEFMKVIELYMFYFKLFGIEKFQMRLSKHSVEGLGKKYVNEPELWIKTEKQVRDVLVKSGIPFVEAENEAAFYGPKIDVQIWSVIGREFTLATNQLDFAVPARFNLSYTDKDGSSKTPICIHRAPLSTHERFIGFLIEHFAGLFPLWLAPKQVEIIPVADKFVDYATLLHKEMKSKGLRVSIDDGSDSFSKKIRNAEVMKVPYIVIVGEKESNSGEVSVRNVKTKEQYSLAKDEFISTLVQEYRLRK